MRVAVIVLALLMPLIAWLSSTGALGPDNGTISDRYPTLLVAAGYAFSIWGLIFAWDVAFGVWQWRARAASRALERARPLAAAGFALTALWMPVFSQQWFGVALLVIWGALACIAAAAIILARDPSPLRGQGLWATSPLALHAGWLSLAAFLNTAQVLVAYEVFDGRSLLGWSLALFAAAAVLLMVLNQRLRGHPAFAAAALWGLAAVYLRQSRSDLPGADTAAWVAMAIAIALAGHTAWLLWQHRAHRRVGATPGL
ncbi:hypothetical protein [Lysobacter sp. A3-1-A15]|uniref:hypothetical protein n=1 Tax=Novilysobacter viscosus TaxID=3098602 RepID=UPI002ED85852